MNGETIQVVEAPNLTSLVYMTDEETSEPVWMFPFRSATSLKHLQWEGPGLMVPLQALENSRQLTALDISITDSSVVNSLSLWPSLSELRSLTLYQYSAPPGSYIAHPFTAFPKYASSADGPDFPFRVSAKHFRFSTLHSFLAISMM